MRRRGCCVWVSLLVAPPASAQAARRSGDFPPGWNGEARTPPLGWRSWNAFGNRITQAMMLEAAEAMVARNRSVSGRAAQVSLCDLGYCAVGVDEGWEGCGQGVDKTQHDAKGNPTIDSNFPDMKQMVADIHSKGLKAGWYLNGCKCGERVEKELNYEGDVRNLHDFGFDAVKIDGCGKQRNQTFYAQLMKQSGRNYSIENCHWGDCTNSDDSSCPTWDWCPFNWYRTSGDINSGSQSWLNNLQTAIKFLDYTTPLSQPGCWAYPDMLEVGRVQEPAPGAFFSWNRAHFGAWCIVSAPLILGMKLSDEKLEPVMDIIGNEEAIRVNQQWSGHPGMLVENIIAPPVPYNPQGATIPSSSAGDFDTQGGASLTTGPSDDATSGAANIRTGGPGQVATILVGTGIVGNGHRLASLSMSFRYLAGYTPPPGQAKQDPTVEVLLLDFATMNVLATLLTTGPLGNYSWDHFKGYSPPVSVDAKDLDLPNDKPVILALKVTNHQRNLQIPVDDKAAGFDVRVTWAAGHPTMHAAPLPSVGSVGYGSGVRSGSGVFGSGQLWAKPQPGGAMAALLINHASQAVRNYTIELSKLNLTGGSYTVRDIWARTSNGTVTGRLALSVAPYDSAFVLLAPR